MQWIKEFNGSPIYSSCAERIMARIALPEMSQPNIPILYFKNLFLCDKFVVMKSVIQMSLGLKLVLAGYRKGIA